MEAEGKSKWGLSVDVLAFGGRDGGWDEPPNRKIRSTRSCPRGCGCAHAKRRRNSIAPIIAAGRRLEVANAAALTNIDLNRLATLKEKISSDGRFLVME